jgi:hypothetical protein
MLKFKHAAMDGGRRNGALVFLLVGFCFLLCRFQLFSFSAFQLFNSL